MSLFGFELNAAWVGLKACVVVSFVNVYASYFEVYVFVRWSGLLFVLNVLLGASWFQCGYLTVVG